MKPEDVPYYTNSEGKWKVDLLVRDYQGVAIGRVIIEGKPHFVIRWNGDINNSKDKGFPVSHGNPVWMLLPPGMKICIEP